MHNIYKSSSHVNTSHHSLIWYSVSSASSSHRRRFPPATVAHDWLPGWAPPTRLRPSWLWWLTLTPYVRTSESRRWKQPLVRSHTVALHWRVVKWRKTVHKMARKASKTSQRRTRHGWNIIMYAAATKVVSIGVVSRIFVQNEFSLTDWGWLAAGGNSQ